MPFVHPAIFWSGLAAVSAPVIIHLLNRRRFRTRDWAAMRFLLDSLRKNRRRLKLEELILMALRCLVILMLALAAARFSGCSALEALPLGQTMSQTAVFVLDDSYSMGQRSGGRAIFDGATAELAEQLRVLPKSAKVAVISTSPARSGDKLAELKTITDIQSVVSHLKDRGLSDTRADLPAALEEAKKLFANVPGPKRLFIQSDFRRIDLAPAGRADELRKSFDELLGAGVGIIAADYGIGPANNLTIEQMAVAGGEEGPEGMTMAGAVFRVRVTVRNNSPALAQRVKVGLAAKFAADVDPAFHPVAGDEIIKSIEPGRRGSCEFAVICNRSGPAVLRAELGDDELAGDNVAYLALDVRKHLSVLIVDDRKDSPEAQLADSYYLRAALQGGTEGAYGCRQETVASRDLAGKALDEYDVVVLTNVADFPASLDPKAGSIGCRQVEELERYVRAGGGLAIFTGDRVNARFHNRFLFAGGKGLSPYEIGERTGDPAKAAQYFRIKVADDPAARNARGNLMRFAGIAGADTTELIRFYAFTSAAAPRSPAPAADDMAEAGPPLVLARFNDPAASPAVALRRFGRGKVLVYYTSADRRWTDWPAYGADIFYVTAMNDMVRFLARPPDPGLNGLAGEVFEMQVPQRFRGAEARLAGVGGLLVGLSARWEKAEERLRYENPSRAAGYAIRFRRAGRDLGAVYFARSADPAEGDLTLGGQAALNAVISGKYEYTRRQVDGEPAALWGKPVKEYWTWALAAMLLFLAVETVLAQKFGHYS